MPAKTVVFTSIRKFDGTDFRIVSSGEYIQMSGRAGRRGLDEKGIVITMLDEKLDSPVIKTILKGEADRLVSAFHLGYNMLLNLLRVEEADPEFMMARSFHQFQTNRQVPQLKQKLKMLEQETQSLSIQDEKSVAEYYHLKSQIDQLTSRKLSIENLPLYSLPFLNPGRVIKVQDGNVDWGCGVVVNFQKKTTSSSTSTKKSVSIDESGIVYIVDVLLLVNTTCSSSVSPIFSSSKISPSLQSSSSSFSAVQSPSDLSLSSFAHSHNKSLPSISPCTHFSINKDSLSKPHSTRSSSSSSSSSSSASSCSCAWVVVPVMLSCLSGISSIRMLVPQDLKKKSNRDTTGKQLIEVMRRFNSEGLPMLDPVQDMKIKDDQYISLIKKLESLEDRLSNHPLRKSDSLRERYSTYEKKLNYEKQIGDLKLQVKAASQDVVMRQSLKSMKRVLRRLGFCNSEGVIDIKGRMACEISTCDELLATELMFGGVLNDLKPEQIVALFSCLVFNEKMDEQPKIKEDLASPFRQLQDVARRVSEVIRDAQLPIDPNEYVNRFQPHMMDMVYSWCKGARFAEICKMTDIFEGTIIRCMRRLEELLRQFVQAAKSIGNTELELKFLTGIEQLKRDIVFAASLYL
eukprot:TRINITY_DN1514_c0_g1_i1.p1 TRINITY_DN1514_c0_g1~~TRINITY_DN1514_c0_g1_i1.p1  ORF type:complete len:630 (-),score=112.30 TRINITY_DN1514_c0_g1_i1:78-1967(-)